MPRTFLRQDTQLRSSDLYDDTLAVGVTLETGQTQIEGDLNALRSQTKRHLVADNAGDWYADINTPVTLDAGSKRGINNLNTDLHELERKRVLVAVTNLNDVTVPATQNFVVLSLAQIPSNTTAAVGAVATRGSVVASIAGSFAAFSLVEVSGTTPISPKNICEIVDGATRDPILSSGRVVWGLLQSESATDGFTITGTTPNRVQISFVRINAAGDDLEAVPVADIESKIINYANVEQKALDDLNEQDFLRGAIVDVPSSSTVTRQVAYDNQGTAPVNLLTNATLDLEAPGIAWVIRDDLEANLFRILEGSAGGTSEIQFGTDVDVFNNDAVVNDFRTGLRADTGGQRIDVGVNAGVIESTGANDLRLYGAAELHLDDSYQAGSTWTATDGVPLADSSAEWSAYKAKYGEVSLLNAIVQGDERNPKVYSNVTVTTVADNDVSLADGNLDTALPDLSLGDFLSDYDVFLNGNLLRPGATLAANNDYYPGSSITAPAKLRFEFTVKINDVLCVIPYA
jgi:hypothetical protein